MARTAEIPAGRRKVERGEHLFVTRRQKRCRAHVMTPMSNDRTGFVSVIACGVCGKLKQGETMPAADEVLRP